MLHNYITQQASDISLGWHNYIIQQGGDISLGWHNYLILQGGDMSLGWHHYITQEGGDISLGWDNDITQQGGDISLGWHNYILQLQQGGGGGGGGGSSTTTERAALARVLLLASLNLDIDMDLPEWLAPMSRKKPTYVFFCWLVAFRPRVFLCARGHSGLFRHPLWPCLGPSGGTYLSTTWVATGTPSADPFGSRWWLTVLTTTSI